MDTRTLLGLDAGFFTTISFVLERIKAWKAGDGHRREKRRVGRRPMRSRGKTDKRSNAFRHSGIVEGGGEFD